MKLLELQRRMAEDVRRPLTADFRMQKIAEGERRTNEIAESYIAPNVRLSSFERLEIYNRQYWFRLTSVISDDFPTLNAMLGSKRFNALLLKYLAMTPSTSWTLRDLGAKLPAFLGEHPELAGRRHRLAVDTARLEWAYVEAFDGGHRDPIDIGDACVTGPASRFSIQPHLRLLALRYPVDSLVLAVKRGLRKTENVSGAARHKESIGRIELPSIRRERVYLAVHRFDDSVYYRRIERESFLLLSTLRLGVPVAMAVNLAFKNSRLTAEGQVDRLRETFAYISELGWLCPHPSNAVSR